MSAAGAPTRVLVTGPEGQLGRSLAERARGRAGIELIPRRRPALDLEDSDAIRATVAATHPDVIINAAGYTAVDRAEEDKSRAQRINALAPGILAAAARDFGACMIHISTDYVFDGTSPIRYTEDMPTAPLGTYGWSKVAGEEAVRANCPDHIIVRTAWLYSPFGRNFVQTMLGLARARDIVEVVDDQFGNPTSALDLADGLLAAVERWRSEPALGLGRTFHLAGSGSTSWAGFARQIFAESARRGGPTAEVEGIPSSRWNARAARPQNSRLDSSRFSSAFAYSMPAWEASLGEVVARIVDEARDQPIGFEVPAA